jgi:hypothetical protein
MAKPSNARVAPIVDEAWRAESATHAHRHERTSELALPIGSVCCQVQRAGQGDRR